MVQFTIVNIGTLSANKFWGETERVHPVSATCTLLEAEGRRLLVDPSPHPEALAQQLFDHAGLRPEAVDAVFCTHWHGDHRFGLELFPDRPWLMAAAGLEEWRAQSPQDAGWIDLFTPAEGRLLPGVELLASPGHTLGHHALIADTRWGPLVVSGDAVMTAEYFAAGEGYRNSVDFELAAETVRLIKARARLVTPGHGNVILNF